MIDNIEPTVEKYIIEAAFKTSFLKCFTLHLSTLIFAYYWMTQASSILGFFGNFTVRLLWQGKKLPSDSQKCTTSVFAPFASSLTDLLNSSGLVKSPWVRALAPLPQSFNSQLLTTHWSDPNAKMDPTGKWFGLNILPTSHAENVAMGQGVQNCSFMDGSPSSAEIYLFQGRIAKKWREIRERNAVTPPSPAELGCIFGKAAAKRWQKVLEVLYKRGRGWEDNMSHMLWRSLRGSTGPKRLIPWSGIKPLLVVAEEHWGTRDACQPHLSTGCTSKALNFCQCGHSPRKHLGMSGGVIVGKSRQELHTGLFWFRGSAVLGRPGQHLGGSPRAWNTETAFVQLFCLCPARLGLPGFWHWLSESLGNFPSKIPLISLE